MLGQVSGLVARCSVEGPTDLGGIEVGDGTCQIQVLIHLVPYLAHGVLQAACQDDLGCHHEAFLLLDEDIAQELGHGKVLHVDDLVHGMYHTIGYLDVLVALIHCAVIVDIEAVGRISVSYGELAVVHIGERQLGIVRFGER